MGTKGTVGPATSRPREVERQWTVALVTALFLGFAFQGSRGFWEPDEGFYVNVALGMTSTQDFWIPRLNGEPFLDKPPLHYWGIAAGLQWIAATEWGARMAQALWYAATAWMVGLLAAAMWGKSRGPEAALRYALMLCPFIAANILTPDTPLTFCVAAAGLAGWKWTAATATRDRLLAATAMGLAVGLGFLAKGPAMLVFTAPLALYFLIQRGLRRLLAVDVLWSVTVALGLGAAWYGSIIQSVPGAFEYLFDNQIRGRLWEKSYNRNPGTLGAFKVYLPVLFFGTLPWSPGWLKTLWQRGFRGRLPSRTDGRFDFWRSTTRTQLLEPIARLRQQPQTLFLTLTIILPFVVFCAASSRLPLYILPLFPALSLIGGARSWRHRRSDLAIWCIGLLAVKWMAAFFPTDTDSRRLAAALHRIGADPATAVVAIEDKKNGLVAYGFENFKWVRLWQSDYPYFTPPPTLNEAIPHISSSPQRIIFVTKTRLLNEVVSRTRGHIPGCSPRAGPLGYSLLDCPSAIAPFTTREAPVEYASTRWRRGHSSHLFIAER